MLHKMLNAESILLLFQVAKIDYCKCYGSWGHAKDGGSSITCHLLTCCRLQECRHRPSYASWPRVCWPLNSVSMSSLQPSWDDKCLISLHDARVHHHRISQPEELQKWKLSWWKYGNIIVLHTVNYVLFLCFFLLFSVWLFVSCATFFLGLVLLL